MNKVHYMVISCLILFCFFSVYKLIPGEDRFYKDSDEGYYFKFASLISENGISYFPYLIKEYTSISHPYRRLFPAPSRPGHILLAVLFFKFFGNSFHSLALLSLYSYILFVVVCFYFSRKLFGLDIACLFTLLSASSPLVMAMGKRALVDSNLNLLWALSVWLFLYFLISKRKPAFFIFLAVYSFAITVKESSLALLSFFIIGFVVYKYYFNKQMSCRYIFYMTVIPILLVGIFYLFLFGGIQNCFELIRYMAIVYFGAAYKVINRYTIFCTGPWYKFIIDYLLLNPIGIFCFIGYSGHMLINRKWDYKQLYFLLYFVVILASFNLLSHGKIVRYVIGSDMAINLFCVLMFYRLFETANEVKKNQMVFISVLTIFLINYHSFIQLFVKFNIYDPISYWLLAARRIIPI